MSMPGYKTKDSVTIVYTGDGKGKTSAAIGLLARALGSGFKVGFVQFIKTWEVGEHRFFETLAPIYVGKLEVYKGGKGFYNLGSMSAKDVSANEHKEAAQQTYSRAVEWATSGDFDLVVCDEINTACQEGLITENQLQLLITSRDTKTSLCLTGRGFPDELVDQVDIVTNMTKVKHHFDEKYLANEGIDY